MVFSSGGTMRASKRSANSRTPTSTKTIFTLLKGVKRGRNTGSKKKVRVGHLAHFDTGGAVRKSSKSDLFLSRAARHLLGELLGGGVRSTLGGDASEHSSRKLGILKNQPRPHSPLGNSKREVPNFTRKKYVVNFTISGERNR